MYKDMGHSCDKAETQNYFYVIDGDNRPDLSEFHVTSNSRGVSVVSSIAVGDMNLGFLKDLIKAQSNRQEPASIGLNVGSDEDEILEKYRSYLAFMETQAMFLPGTTPEELIWSSSIAQNMLNAFRFTPAEVTSHKTRLDEITDCKKKFDYLSKVLGSNDGNEILGLQKHFVTAFIKDNSPGAIAIGAFISYMATTND